MQVKKRIALFVEAHEGLGHFNIVRQLAEDILDQDEAAEVMILSGTLHKVEADQLFRYNRCQIVQLPFVDLVPVGEGRFEYTTPSGETYLKDETAISERMRVVKENLEAFKPEVVVFEFYPFRQSFREPDMAAVQSMGSNILKVCLCRDIIHSRDTAGTLRRLKTFDCIIVRGDDSIVKLADSQREWAGITIPLQYLGYFVAKQPFRKTQMGSADPILVFAGGGFHIDDIDFFRAVITAKKSDEALHNRDLHIYLSSNAKKYMIEGQEVSAYDYIHTMAEKDASIKVIELANHKAFRKAIADASVVITHGGYNTSLETILIGTPLVIIPRFSIPDPEQKVRAEILSRLGLATVFLDSELRPGQVARSITDAIHSFGVNDSIKKQILKVDGSKDSARFILDWIDKD